MYLRSANLVITSSVMMALAIIAVILRLWARRKRGIKIEIDDVLVIIGLILAVGICICNIIGAARFRFGDHEIFIEEGELAGWPVAWLLLGYGKIFYALQLLHATAMPVIKFSFLIFLRKIFGQKRSFRIAFWVVATYIGLWWLTTFWMSVFQCWPLRSNWGTTPEQLGDCIPNYPLWYSWAALLNVLSDVAIVVLPIPLVLKLHMPLHKKLTTLSILATAIIVIVAGIGRTVGYFTYDHSSFDYSYVFYDFLIWTSIEPCLGVVGCCLPTMGHFIDLNYGEIYYKIKRTLSLQSLLGRSTSRNRLADTNRSDNKSRWVELNKLNGHYNGDGQTSGYTNGPDPEAQSLGEVPPVPPLPKPQKSFENI